MDDYIKNSEILNNVPRNDKQKRFVAQTVIPTIYPQQNSFESKEWHILGDEVELKDDIGNRNQKEFIFFSCRKGLKPEMPNQDNLIVSQFEQYQMIAVLDGYGPSGNDVANFVTYHMPKFIQEKIQNWDSKQEFEMNKILNDAFFAMQSMLKSNSINASSSNFDITLSGASVSILIIDTERDMFNFGQVGNCKISIGINEKGKNRLKELTQDHKPIVVSEKKRIHQNGGEVRKIEGDNEMRLFARGQTQPGIALSRTIGCTNGMSVGMLPEPDCWEQEFQSNFDFIFIATDGIWEYCNYKYLTAVLQSGDFQKSSDKISIDSYKKWLVNNVVSADDMSFIIFDLKPFK